MTTRRTAAFHLAWLASFANGCSSVLAPMDAPAALALIDPLPRDIPRAAHALGGVMLVQTPTCRPVYDTTRMAYTLGAHQVEFFARHAWAERPAQMLQPLLVRTLEAARCCTAVIAAPYAGAYDFSLHTELHELVQDFSASPAQLRLSLRIAIRQGMRALAVHDLEFVEPLRERNAEAGVTAANDAVAKALRAVAQHVIQALA
jgi:ABC-type uncharacterized transport system auxiliary subunit